MSRDRPRRRRWRQGLLALCLVFAAVGVWHVHKPLPPGVHVRGERVTTPVESLRFLVDLTATDAGGRRVRRREIHEATLQLVRDAQDFLVLDYFLFNAQGGPAGPLDYSAGLAPVSREIIEALRDLKRTRPDLPVLLITDPINDYYRGTPPPALAGLRELGVDVVVTRLSGLRDSNPVYSAGWRTLFGWWLPTGGAGWLPNLLDGEGPGLKLGALLRLPNFKANHRKLVITGDGAGSLRGIVASANPHDASSAHSNVALWIEGEALRPLLASELEVARFSGWKGGTLETWLMPKPRAAAGSGQRVDVAVITEGAIRAALLEQFAGAGEGDAIDVAQFYLAERHVLDAMLAASRRGVAVRVLLDPNRDAFGFEKSGIPNRPVGNALVRDSAGRIALRWYRTQGEQFHAKYAAVRRGDRLWFTVGSANFTRRNIGDLNLEANVEVHAPASSAIARQATEWFEAIWNNRAGLVYSDPADTWAEDSRLRLWQSRMMEATGLSTF